MRGKETLLVLAFALAGCGSGGGDTGPLGSEPAVGDATAVFDCTPLGGGAATIQAGCLNCSQSAIADAANAIDGDLATAAILNTYHPDDLASQATVLTLTATAQDGVVFPEMSRAGIAMRAPKGLSNYRLTINALLDGQIQGTHWESPVQRNGEFVYVGFDGGITKPFDTLQLVIDELQPSVEEHVYAVFEFCGDGALR